MKLLKGVVNFFNFGAKYRKQEAAYHDESRRRGPVGHLITLILTSAVPLLGLWGAFEIPWTNSLWLLKILCIAISFMIITTPSELFILGVVALRHRARMKIQNSVEDAAIKGVAETISGKELTEEDEQRLKERKARGTADKMDLVIGILAIVMSVVVIVAFVGMFFGFCAHRIRRLK